jgi:hypothetical protein
MLAVIKRRLYNLNINRLLMKKEINHRPYILIGCLIWIAAFFGESFGLLPYSSIGIIASPIITIFGVIHWVKYYKRTRGHLPNFFEAYAQMNKRTRKNPFAGFGFMLKHILEFWTFAIISWMGLFLFTFLTFGQSEAFKTAKEYCESNAKIIEKTGEIKYYGLFFSGSISNQGETGESNMTFNIVGENGIFNAKAELTKYNNIWEVPDLEVKQ